LSSVVSRQTELEWVFVSVPAVSLTVLNVTESGKAVFSVQDFWIRNKHAPT